MPFLTDTNLPRVAPIAQRKELQPLIFNGYDEQNAKLKRLRSQEFNTNWGEAAMFSVAGTAVSAFDTMASSLGIVDVDTTEEYLAERFPEFTNFMLRHRDTLQVSGDVASMFLLGGAAAGAVRTGGFIGRSMQKMFGNKVTPFLSTGRSAKRLSEIAYRRANLKKMANLPQQHSIELDKAFRQAKSYVAKRRVADFAIEAVAAEAAIAVGMNSSEFLFPEEMSTAENVAWALGTNAIIGGGVLAHGVWVAKRAAMAITGAAKKGSTNPGDLPLADLPGNTDEGRGAAIAVLGQYKDDIKKQAVDIVPGSEAGTNIATTMTAVNEAITKHGQRAMQRTPISGVNRAGELSPGQARTLSEHAEANKLAMASMQSLEPDPVSNNNAWNMQALESRRSEKLAAISLERVEIHGKLEDFRVKAAAKLGDEEDDWEMALTPKQALAHEGMLKKLHELVEEENKIKRLNPATLEVHGGITVGTSRATIFHDGEQVIQDITDRAVPGKATEYRAVLSNEAGDSPSPSVHIDADAAGVVRTPSRHCPIPPAAMRVGRGSRARKTMAAFGEAGAAGGMNAILHEFGLEGTQDLAKRLAITPRQDWARSENVQALRKALHEHPDMPDQFVAYGKGDDTTTLKFRQGEGEGFSNPRVVTVDDVVGMSAKGDEVYVDLPEMQAMTSATFSMLNHQQKTATWALLERHLEDNVNPAYVLAHKSKATHHTQLDYIGEIMARHDIGKKPEHDALAFQSLSSKFNDFQVMRQQADEIERRYPLRKHPYQNMDNIVHALNIDNESGILEFFDSLRLEKGTLQLEDMYQNLDELMQDMKRWNSMPAEEIVEASHFRGPMLDMGRNKRPIAAYLDNEISMDQDVREALVKKVATARASFIESLVTNPSSRIVASVVSFTKKNPHHMAAIKNGVQQIMHGTHMYGPLSRHIWQQHFLLRDLPGAEAMDTAIDNMQKIFQKAVEGVFKAETDVIMPESKTGFGFFRKQQNIGPQAFTRQEVMNSLLAKDAESVAALEMFHVFSKFRAQGWDLSEQAVEEVALPGGKKGYRFLLGESKKNAQLWDKLYGLEQKADSDETFQAVTNQTALPVPGQRDVPLVIPEKTFQAIRAIGEIMKEHLAEVNTLRKAQGYQPIKEKSFWLPPAALRGKEVVYLINEAGKVARVVSDATEDGAMSRAHKEIKESKEPLIAVNHNSMQRYHNANLEAIYEMDDFSSSSRQTGPGTGKTAGVVFDRGAEPYKEMQQSILRAWADLDRNLRQEIFSPEMEYLAMEHAATGASSKDETIYSMVMNRVAGTQRLDPNTYIGRGYLMVANAYDEMLRRVNDKFLKQDSRGEQKRADKVVTALHENLGKEYTPFENGLRYIEQTHKAALPGTLRKHAALLNEVTAAAAIRVMDVGMSVLNIGSLAVTMPVVARAINPQKWENVQQWQERVSAFGGVTPKGTPWMSPTKIMTNGFRWMLTKEGQAVREIAAAKGYMDQYAAEAVGAWDQAGESFVANRVRDTVNKLSVFTDKSERMARGIAFMSFYNMGKKGLGLETEAAMVFAHKQANNTIADFRPGDRPTIFQGATGMPLALFTTYMWNFLQRMYRMVETADARTAATQIGLQTSLFGVNTLPGAQAYIQALGANEDGTLNIEDRISDLFGRSMTDVIMHGTVSTVLPRSIGLGGGIDIGSRAGIGLPFSRVLTGDIIGEPSSVWENLWRASPGLQFAGRLYDTAQEATDRILAEGGFDGTDAIEILAASNINKGLSNILEIAQGYSIDHAQHIIEDDTRTRIGVAARIAGFKPMRNTQTRDELRRVATIKKMQGGMKEKLGDWVNVELRKGTLTADRMDEAFGDYVKAGGSPENFKQWFLSQARKASTNKLDMAIVEGIRANDAERRVGRLLFLQQDDY